MERTKHPKKEKIRFGLPGIEIPSEVLFHPNLTNTEKILFGFLRNLAQGKDGCWASNHYLSNLLGVGEQTISNAIANLRKHQFIEVCMEQTELRTNRKIFINPEFPIIYHETMVEIQDQLKSGTLQENLYIPIKKIIHPYKKTYSKYINKKNNKNNIPQTKKQNTTWKQLVKQYGRSQVKFVKYFLEKQKENFPKLIKEDITPNSNRVLTSLDCIDKLQRIDGFDFETEIKPILEAVLQDEFWAKNVLSLGSLRNKGRNGEKKFVNIQTTLSLSSRNLPINHLGTPDEIIAKQGWSEDKVKLLKEQVFSPILAKLRNPLSKAEVTQAICKLIVSIDQRQHKPPKPKTEEEYLKKKEIYCKWDLIPGAIKLVGEFTRWLNEQDWIGVLKPGHFDIEGKTFQTFLDEYQRKIGFDVFEGRRLT